MNKTAPLALIVTLIAPGIVFAKGAPGDRAAPASSPASRAATPPASKRKPRRKQSCASHAHCDSALRCIGGFCVQPPPAAPPRASGIAKKGSARLGGTFAVVVDAIIGGEGSATTGATVLIAPSAGYFVANGVELGFELTLNLPLGDATLEPVSAEFALAPYVRLMMSGSTFFPYVALGAGPRFSDLLGSYVSVFLDFGLMVKLGAGVALNFAIRPNLAFHVGSGTSRTLFTLPIGMLGIHAFY